ncbi:hypothetical protein CHARACLAT_026219 [Characodon lateralis]|uniref:Uncharacterized protein n=1 Tax=Characodon lateralis TaxID=208331 RepID=A0ABU7EEF1_9TELE|nr:hypothetical protein [Characodon lateralis]
MNPNRGSDGELRFQVSRYTGNQVGNQEWSTETPKSFTLQSSTHSSTDSGELQARQGCKCFRLRAFCRSAAEQTAEGPRIQTRG